ncbi:thiamine biosynthesis lipoprotein [Roseimicrobium gellanilyticum]|uniref:FAD:protein FMN transferase n=1 Tax=Roseimicrobium gellanilyticum TaxID=748857 RepID=A0A366H2G1_9BACT|nr:FAD:protein FMN transferase [Roseimicrobium gellanilyticum]RBP36090.1 thiamine biosynthesis lipoprotein [Roseimicrobium gellanilyticum]
MLRGRKLLKLLIMTATMTVVLFLIPDCPRNNRLPQASGPTMGTSWHLTLAEGNTETASKMVQSRLDTLEALFTNWRENSAVSRFNASRSTDWQAVPRELAEVMIFAQRLSKETHGAFDVTASPLIELWGFGVKKSTHAIPADDAIAAARARVGWQKVEVQLDPPMLRKAQADVEINVSGLVEGYAVDDLVKRLHDTGHPNFLLDVGGELYASGMKPDGSPWQVGVQQPDADKGVVTGAVPLQDKALSTSGTYQQFFEIDGKRYPHVLDARTGRPVTHSLVSVSVISNSCFEADSWTTTLLILGLKEGKETAARLGIDALFIEQAGAHPR